MFNKALFSKFLDFFIDNEEQLKKQGVAIDCWLLGVLFGFEEKAGRVAFMYELINELESFRGLTYEIKAEQIVIGKAENAIELSYPFNELPQLKQVIFPALDEMFEANSYGSRSGDAVPLLIGLYMLQQRIKALKAFDWDVYHQDSAPYVDLVSTSDVNGLEHLIEEAEEFVEGYLDGEGEYFPDAAHEALSGDYDNWQLDDHRDLAEMLGDTELLSQVDELKKVIQLFHKISEDYCNFHKFSYELYQDRLSSQRYKNECENEAN